VLSDNMALRLFPEIVVLPEGLIPERIPKGRPLIWRGRGEGQGGLC